MKKYKFLILSLLFGLFFIPKDVFALDIHFYTSDYVVINSCYDCTSLSAPGVARVRFTYPTQVFQNLEYRFQFDTQFHYYNTTQLPTTHIGLFGANIEQNLGEYIWKGTIKEFPSTGGVLRGYSFDASWTQTTNGNNVFTEIYFDNHESYDLFSVVVDNYSLITTGDSTSDVIAGVGQQIIDNQNKNHKEAENTRKGIWETIKDLPNQFLNMLKSLFIPDDNYFSDKFNTLLDKLNNQLGLLSYPLTLVVETFEFFITIEDNGEYVIRWDDIKVPNFEEYTLIKAGYLDFSQLLRDIEPLRILHSLYMVFINALLVLSFVKLCHNTYVDVFGGQYDDYEYISIAEENYFDTDGVLKGSRTVEKTTQKRKVV